MQTNEHPQRRRIQSLRLWLAAGFVGVIGVNVLGKLAPPSDALSMIGLIVLGLYALATYKLARALERKNAWFYPIAAFLPFVGLALFIWMQVLASRWLRGAIHYR